MANEEKPKILLMVSGGPDSATLAQLAQKEGGVIHAIYLRTGHPSDEKEIAAANEIVKRVGGKLEIIDLTKTIAALGGLRILIHSEASIMPFGNAIALSLASSYGIKIGADKIMVGLHKDDADENVEYTESYIRKLADVFHFANQRAPIIEVPLIALRKFEVFKLGLELGVDYSVTWSCIRNSAKHCGDCGACRARRKAFVLAGIPDPTEYEIEPAALDTLAVKSVSA